MHRVEAAGIEPASRELSREDNYMLSPGIYLIPHSPLDREGGTSSGDFSLISPGAGKTRKACYRHPSSPAGKVKRMWLHLMQPERSRSRRLFFCRVFIPIPDRDPEFTSGRGLPATPACLFPGFTSLSNPDRPLFKEPRNILP